MTAPRGAPLDASNLMETAEEYLLELQVALKSKDYIRMARVALIYFSDFCVREGLDHPDKVTRTDLLKFQTVLNAHTEWTESYRQQLMKYIRTFYGWAVDVGHVTTSPFIRIRIGSTPKKPHPLSDDEVAMIFHTHQRSAFSMNAFAFHRRELILAILFTWGLRVHEAAALNVEDMDPKNDFVVCRNKGGSTKQLPYPDELKKIYQRWVRVRGQNARPDEPALFIGAQGDRIEATGISRIISDLGKEAGVNVNAHQFRDTCGTNLLNSDMPVERVAKILGHKNIKQTLAYSEVRNEKVADDLTKVMAPKLRVLFRNTRDLT